MSGSCYLGAESGQPGAKGEATFNGCFRGYAWTFCPPMW